MSQNISLVKGKVVIQDKFSAPEQTLLIEKYKTKKIFEFWRTPFKSLAFLKDLSSLESLSLINLKVDDPSALSEIKSLKTLFLNGIKPGSGWDFLANLTQIEELHILNIKGELNLPDLQKLDHLKIFRIWGCKGLTDISALKNTRQLEEVELVDAALTPDALLPLLEKPAVKYLSASFSKKADKDLFQTYLDKYGKKAYREET